MTRFLSEALAKHEGATFASSHYRIDRYFQKDIRRSHTACYALVEQSSGRHAGFYVLSAHSILLNDVPANVANKLPRYPSVPVVLISWLGRDKVLGGAGVGSLLLYDAIRRVVRAPVGVYAICADAIDESAIAFYREHQFQPLPSRPQTLFLPMKTAVALVDGTA